MHDLRATVKGFKVNIHAYVCVRSASEALKVTPDELRLTQYLIYKRKWRRLRTVIESGYNWVVSLGENWGGKSCGWLDYDDVWYRPEGFPGFDNPAVCVGVSFSIKVAGRTATKRVAIRCPSA
jgi:hypothetical protein